MLTLATTVSFLEKALQDILQNTMLDLQVVNFHCY